MVIDVRNVLMKGDLKTGRKPLEESIAIKILDMAEYWIVYEKSCDMTFEITKNMPPLLSFSCRRNTVMEVKCGFDFCGSCDLYDSFRDTPILRGCLTVSNSENQCNYPLPITDADIEDPNSFSGSFSKAHDLVKNLRTSESELTLSLDMIDMNSMLYAQKSHGFLSIYLQCPFSSI